MLRRLSIALAVGLGIAGCSLLAPSDDELLGGSGKPGTGGASSGGAGGTTGSGGGSGGTSPGGTGGSSAAGGSGGGAGVPSGGAGGGGGSGGTSCTPSAGPASPRPISLIILLDRTASMVQNNKWTLATGAVNDLANDAKASGIQVALQYMDLTGGQCDGTGYSTPAVPFAPLPGNATALASSMAQTTPTGVTNLEGALNGIKSMALARLAQQPDVQLVTAFITDVTAASGGGGCSTSLAVFTGILGSVWPSATTYVIALQGAQLPVVSPLAAAGGSQAAIDASSGAPAIKAGLLRSVRPCRFAVPPGNASFTLKLAAGDVPLTKAASAASCDDKSWFSVATSPSTAALCPAVCAQLDAVGSSIESVVSCP